jgi:nitrite reductase/ring-hydroxylating ferredoxin subunit
MKATHRLANANDIPPGKAMAFDVGQLRIAVFNVNGEFFALDDMCPHAGAPLSQGEVCVEKVTCPFHAADFNLRTGEKLSPPARRGVKAYKVLLHDDQIHLELE